MVPEGWKLVEAKDVCESISVGVVIKPTQYYVEENDGVKAFRSANVREGFINDNDWVYFSHEGHAANKKSQLKAGDVLIVRTGYPGTACVVTPEFEGSNAIDIVIARPDMRQIISEYLCAYTNSHMGKSQVLDLQGGMAQKHLNVGAYQVLKIKLPPALEQKKIAQILSTWDQAITTAEQLLANSQQQKKALMQQLLTGKKRLFDKNGVRFSGEWQACQLSDVVYSLDSGVSVNGIEQDVKASHFVLKTSCVSDGVFAPEEVKRVVEEKEITRLKEPLRDGSILISRMNTPALVGANSYVECAPDNTYLPDRLWQVKATQSKVLMRWLAFWFSSEKTRTALSDLASGTSSSMKNISKKAVLAMSIQCPSLEEQQKIAAVLSAADQEISALRQKLDALKQEKKNLMQQLLTGKRRVSVDDKEAA